jgi:multidrug resistance efflux pump
MDDEMRSYLKALREKYLWFWPLTDLLEKMMADIAQIQADVKALQDAEAAAANELQALADSVAELQAGAVSQEQIENLHDSLQSVTTSLVAATQSAQLTAEGTPPTVNPENPNGIT